jgi:hypothetical protein
MYRRRDPDAARRVFERRSDVGRQQRAAIENGRAVDERQYDRGFHTKHVLRWNAADYSTDAGETAFDFFSQPSS